VTDVLSGYTSENLYPQSSSATLFCPPALMRKSTFHIQLQSRKLNDQVLATV
jgi:hypothetical protein